MQDRWSYTKLNQRIVFIGGAVLEKTNRDPVKWYMFRCAEQMLFHSTAQQDSHDGKSSKWADG